MQTHSETRSGHRRVWIAFVVALLAGIAPSVWLLDGSPVWDDNYYLAHYIGKAIERGLRPFAFDSATYWRPLGTGLMALPMHWIQPMGGEGYFMLFSKAVSLAMFALAGLAAGAYALRGADGSKAAGAAVLGVLIGIHPAFAEPSMWWSDRYDLMMCGWVALMLSASTRPESSRSLAIGALLGAAACLTKESGFFWTAGLATLCAIVHGRKQWRFAAGLALAAVVCALVRTAVIAWVAPAFFEGDPPMFERVWSLTLYLSMMGRYAIFALYPAADPGPIHFSTDLPEAMWLGVALLASMAGAIWAGLRARSQGRPEAAMAYGWFALAVAVAAAQGALVARLDIEVTFPSFSMRYAAPSIMVLLAMAGRAAMGTGRRSAAALAGLALILVFAAPVSTPSKIGYSSEVNLWEQTYLSHPTPEAVTQYCASLNGNGMQTKARQIAKEWRAAHPNERAPKLDKLFPVENPN